MIGRILRARKLRGVRKALNSAMSRARSAGASKAKKTKALVGAYYERAYMRRNYPPGAFRTAASLRGYGS